MKKALLIVAASFLLYNIYQTIVSTIFISHFPFIIGQLPNFIKSSQPTLQLTLFILQESVASVGSYLRLVGGIFAFNCALLFFRRSPKYLESLRRAVLFESLYFLLLLPAGINHLVGSVVSSSQFLNFYTGVSFLLQVVLIFPSLFMLSRKLKKPQYTASILKWAGNATVLYVFGFWIKQGLMWVYAILPSGSQQASLIGTIGSVNSVLTLIVAAIVSIFAWLAFRQTEKLNSWLAGTVILLVGVYFVVYAFVSIWLSIYLAFLPLTDFWMITLPILGVAILLKSNSTIEWLRGN